MSSLLDIGAHFQDTSRLGWYVTYKNDQTQSHHHKHYRQQRSCHLVPVADELQSAALGLSAVRWRLGSDFAACRLEDSPNSALWYPESWEI